MATFDDNQIARAIERLPTLSSKDIGELRSRAESKRLSDLVDACDRELERRPFDFSTEAAVAFETMAEQVADLDLEEAIRHAFTKVLPASPDEVRFLRWLAAHPGGSYQEAVEALQNEGLSLWIGHLVYDRYGCFRKFLEGAEDQSSILIAKDRSGPSVRYRLKPEAAKVLGAIGLI